MLLLLALAAALAAEAPPALFCLDGACEPVRGTRVPVTATDAVRPAVWIVGGGARVVAARVASRAVNARLDDDAPAASHRVIVRTTEGLPEGGFAFELRGDDTRWAWSLPKLPVKGIELLHPACDCVLKVQAKGYAAAETLLRKGDATPAVMHLRRLPVLSGRVIDGATGEPLVDVEVAPVGSEPIGRTDASGRFSMAIEGEWPAAVRLTHVLRVPRTLAVPKLIADADLGTVVLDNGGSIHAAVVPLADEQLRWQLRRFTGPRQSKSVREEALSPGQTELTIDGLEAGRYVLLLAGREPLQRSGVPVNVVSGKVAEASLQIRPAVVEIEATLGEKELASAEVMFGNLSGGWEETVLLDAKGRGIHEIWQQGDFDLLIVAPAVRAWSTTMTITGDGRIPVAIRIPDRVVRGRVLDGGDNSPVAEAVVSLQSSDGLMTTVRTAADGGFMFAGVAEGAQVVSVQKAGYRAKGDWRFSLADADRVVTRDLHLERSETRRAVAVVDARGIPLPATSVLLASPRGFRDVGRTDAAGRLLVPLFSGEERGLFFAVPRSGSLGFARFAASAGSDLLTIQVADGTASLEIRTESLDGDPIPRVPVLMRIDGVAIPIDVYSALRQHQGVPLQSDERGRLLIPRLPPGHYELWPWTNRHDLELLYSGSMPPAPVRMTLVAGHQTAILKFAAR
ncbi:MAG TPA: carboxypeptidase-like regulatory domain-containing protein [Thermoanaerobaculia bacterium]|jgi:hypothetical protein